MQATTTADVIRFVRLYAAVIADQRQALTRLDAAIGDGDHGDNLNRGFKAALERLPCADEATPGEVLKAVATALISKVGGAAGPLYGTAFLRASTSLGSASELGTGQVVDALAAALEGVKARGKADVGDKTMIDAWAPAVDAARAAQARGEDLAAVLGAAEAAARQGVADTIPLVARKGRASYLGERSAGHQDPGATSSLLLFQALVNCEGERQGAE
jgi:phosphoenolpyruvate---glycerone phosphotransferase subunit DhaL